MKTSSRQWLNCSRGQMRDWVQDEISKPGYAHTYYQTGATLSARVPQGTSAFLITRLTSAVTDSPLPQQKNWTVGFSVTDFCLPVSLAGWLQSVFAAAQRPEPHSSSGLMSVSTATVTLLCTQNLLAIWASPHKSFLANKNRVFWGGVALVSGS